MLLIAISSNIAGVNAISESDSHKGFLAISRITSEIKFFTKNWDITLINDNKGIIAKAKAKQSKIFIIFIFFSSKIYSIGDLVIIK